MVNDPNIDSSTVIGESILIEGELEGDEDLTVEGKVSGSITLTKDLYIQPAGIVQANLNVRNVVIHGVLVGNILASERVEIAAGGRMVGDINSPRILINDGAAFRGRIDMGEDKGEKPDKPSQTKPSAPQPYRSPSPPSKAAARAAATPPKPEPKKEEPKKEEPPKEEPPKEEAKKEEKPPEAEKKEGGEEKNEKDEKKETEGKGKGKK